MQISSQCIDQYDKLRIQMKDKAKSITSCIFETLVKSSVLLGEWYLYNKRSI